MDTEILKIISLAIIGIVVISVIKNIKPEFTVYLVIATTVIIFALILDKLVLVFRFLNSIYSEVTYGRTFFPILMKVLAIAYITDFTAQLCRDAGEGAIASKTELAGKVLIFYISLPVLVTILDLINSVL